MSTKYRSSRDVPMGTIITRLNELSDAITGGRESQGREFTMRIPAECDRDADLVIGEAAVRLAALQAENEALRAAMKEIADWVDRWTTPGHPVSTVARAALDRHSVEGESDE